MSEIFTPKAKSAMVLAAREAILFKHQAVGTEHLLLALMLEEELQTINHLTYTQIRADYNLA